MSDPLIYFLIAVAVILVLLDLWAIASVWRSSKGVEAKMLWVLVIALLPVAGLVAWGIAGPRGLSPASSPEHSKG